MQKNRKQGIELLSMAILRQYGITESPGKYLEKIVRGENIELLGYDQWPDDICGRILYIEEEKRFVIFYNKKHRKEVQAFTIAHELGHYFLKHLQDDQPEVICLNRDFQKMDDSAVEREQREVEANYFAACLLLPLDLIKPVFQHFLNAVDRTGVLYVDKQRCNFMDYKKCISVMKLNFMASETAIRYRLVNLGWMNFNIKFDANKDKGLSIADFTETLKNQYR